MKREYDFSQGEQGKFYRPEAQFNIPIYLDNEVLAYLSEKARSKGVEVNQLVNDILKKDIDLIEAVK
jgi:predicted HicB family RNase H-like nuclease